MSGNRERKSRRKRCCGTCADRIGKEGSLRYCRKALWPVFSHWGTECESWK